MAWFPTVVHPFQILAYGKSIQNQSNISGYERLARNYQISPTESSGLHGNTFGIVEENALGFVGWQTVCSHLYDLIDLATDRNDIQILLCPIGTTIQGITIEAFEEVVESLSWPSNVVFLWRELLAERNIMSTLENYAQELARELEELSRVTVIIDPPLFPESELQKAHGTYNALRIIDKYLETIAGVHEVHYEGLSSESRDEIARCVSLLNSLTMVPRSIILKEIEHQYRRIEHMSSVVFEAKQDRLRIEYLNNELAYVYAVVNLLQQGKTL